MEGLSLRGIVSDKAAKALSTFLPSFSKSRVLTIGGKHK